MRRRQTARESAPIRGYADLSVGELRAKLRRKSPEDLMKILRYERLHKKRRGAIQMIRGEIDRKRVVERRLARALKGPGRPTAAARPTRRKREAPRDVAVIEIERRLGTVHRPFSRQALLDRLSEFLQFERDRRALYDLGLERFRHREDILDRLSAFRDVAKKHVEAFEEIVRGLGADPARTSEQAEIARAKARAFFETDRPGPIGEASYLESVLLAALKGKVAWEWIGAAAERLEDRALGRRLAEAATEFAASEAEHFAWARTQALATAIESFFEVVPGGKTEEEMRRDAPVRSGDPASLAGGFLERADYLEEGGEEDEAE
jgi:hypothetical protein